MSSTRREAKEARHRILGAINRANILHQRSVSQLVDGDLAYNDRAKAEASTAQTRLMVVDLERRLSEIDGWLQDR